MIEYRRAGPDTGQSGGIPGHAWTGATGFALDTGRRALLWVDEVILLLQPATAANSPRASFTCIARSTLTEHAICADPVLAGWDRSVAVAYQLGLNGSEKGEGWEPTDDPATLQQSQLAWLAERNRCGVARDCLLEMMYARADALISRLYR